MATRDHSARRAASLALLLAAPAVGAALAAQAPEVTTCSPRIEHEARWSTLSVRGLQGGCEMTIAELAALIERGMEDVGGGEVTSLFLGRIVEYPEIGRALLAAAAAQPEWRGERPPHPGVANRLVAEVLATSEALRPVRESLASRGLRATGASCEKVLVVIGHPSVPEWAAGRDGLPFDAMCWIRLATMAGSDD